MIFEKAINEVNKGCGKEFIIDLIGHYAKCGVLKKPNTLCPTCQKELDTLQKCSNTVEEVLENLKCYCECCAFADRHEDKDILLNKQEIKEELKEVELK